MKRWSIVAVAAGLSLVLVEPAAGQLKFLKRIPGLAKLFEQEPAITTTIEDARTEVPFLDGFDPGEARPMAMLPRTPEGGFVLVRPGNYLFEAESYCLAPGKYAPQGDSGYLYAPLKGPRAEMVRHVLQGTWLHPGIDQQQAQGLIWAIVSRAKYGDMSPQMQQAAARLLTPDDIRRLDRKGLDVIPESLRDEAFGHLPDEARAVMEAQSRLRELVYEADSTYQDLERAAVRFGAAPPGPGSRDVPPGRWSYHPDGFFLRFFPRGYRRMLIQLYLPERFAIQRDADGRITYLLGPDRQRLVITYDDTSPPLRIANQENLTAWAFSGVRCDRWQRSRPEAPEPATGPAGWTFVGVPDSGREMGTPSPSFEGIKDRYDWAQRHLTQLRRLEAGLATLRGEGTARPIASGDLDRIMALGHLAEAMEAVGETAGHQLATLAWQFFVASATQGYRSEASLAPGGHTIFDPSADPPSGNSAEQHVGNSPQGTDDDEDCEDQLEQCLADAEDIAAIDVDDCYKGIDEGSGECDMWELHGCMNSLDLVDPLTGKPVWPGGVDPVACINEHCNYFEPGDSPLGNTGSDGLSPDQQNDLVKCIDDALKDFNRNKEECGEKFPCP